MACGGGKTASQLKAFSGFVGGSGYSPFEIKSIITATGNLPILQSIQGTIQTAGLSIGSEQDLLDNPLEFMSSSAASSISSAIGVENSFLTGHVPEIASSSLSSFTGSNFMDKMMSYVETYAPIDISSSLQIFDQVDNFSKSSIDLMPIVTRQLNTSFGNITSLKDFTDGGYLGGSILNFNDLLTNGLSGLTDGTGSATSLLSSNLSKLGKFGDLSDISNLMNPGQIANQLIQQDLGDIGGIANNLLKSGVPLNDLTNPIYQTKIQQVLNSVTNITDVSDIQKVMGSTLNINSLGDITNFSKIIDSNIPVSFSSFTDLSTKLNIMDLGSIENIGQLGESIQQLTTGEDLTRLLTKTELLDQADFNLIETIYGNGTGPDGSLLIRDLVGTVGAYGHEDYLNTYQQAMNSLQQSGELSSIQQRYSEISSGISGVYTTEVSPGTFRIVDPVSTLEYSTLNDFINAKTTQISSDLSTLLNSSDSDTQAYIQSAKQNWNNSGTQINNELTRLAQTDINPSLITPGHKGSMLSFATRLGERGLDLNDASNFLDRLATDDEAGEAVKFALREGRNIEVFKDKQIKYVGDITDIKENIPVYIRPST